MTDKKKASRAKRRIDEFFLETLENKAFAEEFLGGKIEKNRREDESLKFKFNETPKSLYEKIRGFVIGQDDALQNICNAVCYHYKSIGHCSQSSKNNLLLIGPTGCGKTYVMEKISSILDIPVHISDATKYSATGYEGYNVEDLIQGLVAKAEGDLNKASRGIIYLDEIDKIAAKNISGRDISGKDVQNGLLKIAEGGEVPVNGKGGGKMLSTKNILFAGGGAFSEIYGILRGKTPAGTADSGKNEDINDGEALFRAKPSELIESLKKYGMIPELLGRFSTMARFRQLSQEDLVSILLDSKESPVKILQRDFKAYGIDVDFEKNACIEIAKMAYSRGTGARGLKSAIEETLTSLKFCLPGTGITRFTVSAELLHNPEEGALKLIKAQKSNAQA